MWSPTAERAMDFYSCEGKVVRRDQEACFGWSLSELERGAAPALLELRVEAPSDDESSEDSELGTLLSNDDSAAYQSLSLMQCLSPSADELSRLVDRSSPTHRPLEAVLNVERSRPGAEPEPQEPLRRVTWGLRLGHTGDWQSSPRRHALDKSTNELHTAMCILQGKLRAVEDSHRQMMLDIDGIHRGLQAAIVTTSRLTKAARSLVDEMQDVRYLDELIFMMEGNLDRISHRVWPFTIAHVTLGPDTCEEYNLVV